MQRKDASQKRKGPPQRTVGVLPGFGGYETLFVFEPGVRFHSGQALDVFLFILAFCAAVDIQEVVALFVLIEGLFVACRVAEHTAGALFDEGGSFGVVFAFGNNLFHDVKSFLVFPIFVILPLFCVKYNVHCAEKGGDMPATFGKNETY